MIDFVEVVEIVNECADILANDNAENSLNVFCNATWAKDIHVFVSLNHENPPSQDDYPFIICYEPRIISGEDSRLLVYELEFAAFVYDENLDTTNPRITKFRGLERVSRLAGLAKQEIFKNLPKSKLLRLSSVDSYSATSMFPLFRGDFSLTANRPKTSRGPMA